MLFRIAAIEAECKDLLIELPQVSNSVAQVNTNALVKEICPRHPTENLEKVALVRLKALKYPDWRAMVNFDQALVKIYNARAYRKQKEFKGSILSSVLLPLTRLDCTCD